jgi:uncharacterized protein DUF3576
MWQAMACLVALAGLFLGLAACQYADPNSQYPQRNQHGQPYYGDQPSVFGPGGLTLFNSGQKRPGDTGEGGGGIGVNSFLWRASLDTVAFMPITSADPFGGVILTDWYNPPDTPDERFKVSIFILGRELRADGVRASVFRQKRSGAGWVDETVTTQTNTDLEDAILTRARQLRIASSAG